MPRPGSHNSRRLKCCIPLSLERSAALTSRTYIARPLGGGRSARPSRRARATRGGHSNRDAAIRVDSAAWTPCASVLRRKEGRGSLEQIALLTQPRVLASQPGELGALVSRDAIVALAVVELVRAAPVAQRLRRHGSSIARRACGPDATARSPHAGTPADTQVGFGARQTPSFRGRTAKALRSPRNGVHSNPRARARHRRPLRQGPGPHRRRRPHPRDPPRRTPTRPPSRAGLPPHDQRLEGRRAYKGGRERDTGTRISIAPRRATPRGRPQALTSALRYVNHSRPPHDRTGAAHNQGA